MTNSYKNSKFPGIILIILLVQSCGLQGAPGQGQGQGQTNELFVKDLSSISSSNNSLIQLDVGHTSSSTTDSTISNSISSIKYNQNQNQNAENEIQILHSSINHNNNNNNNKNEDINLLWDYDNDEEMEEGNSNFQAKSPPFQLLGDDPVQRGVAYSTTSSTTTSTSNSRPQNESQPVVRKLKNGMTLPIKLPVVNRPFQVTLLAVIMLVAICGNASVILNISRDALKLRMVHFILIRHVAISDMLGAFLVLPTPLIGIALGEYDFGDSVCSVVSTTTASLWTIHLLSVALFRFDRVLALWLPTGRYPPISVRTTHIGLVIVWVCAIGGSYTATMVFGHTYQPALALCLPNVPVLFFVVVFSGYIFGIITLTTGYVFAFARRRRKRRKREKEVKLYAELGINGPYCPYYEPEPSPGGKSSEGIIIDGENYDRESSEERIQSNNCLSSPTTCGKKRTFSEQLNHHQGLPNTIFTSSKSNTNPTITSGLTHRRVWSECSPSNIMNIEDGSKLDQTGGNLSTLNVSSNLTMTNDSSSFPQSSQSQNLSSCDSNLFEDHDEELQNLQNHLKYTILSEGEGDENDNDQKKKDKNSDPEDLNLNKNLQGEPSNTTVASRLAHSLSLNIDESKVPEQSQDKNQNHNLRSRVFSNPLKGGNGKGRRGFFFTSSKSFSTFSDVDDTSIDDINIKGESANQNQKQLNMNMIQGCDDKSDKSDLDMVTLPPVKPSRSSSAFQCPSINLSKTECIDCVTKWGQKRSNSHGGLRKNSVRDSSPCDGNSHSNSNNSSNNSVDNIAPTTTTINNNKNSTTAGGHLFPISIHKKHNSVGDCSDIVIPDDGTSNNTNSNSNNVVGDTSAKINNNHLCHTKIAARRKWRTTKSRVKHYQPKGFKNLPQARRALASYAVSVGHLLLYLPAMFVVGLKGSKLPPGVALCCGIIVYAEFLIQPIAILLVSQKLRIEVIATLKQLFCYKRTS